MNTYIFPNPTPELFDFMIDLSQSHPEIQITITVETQNLASQNLASPQNLVLPTPKTSNPIIQECPQCHEPKMAKWFTKSGICQRCSKINFTNRKTNKGPKENQEIQRNHDIIWGPESPG